jgi:hypothetical protein
MNRTVLVAVACVVATISTAVAQAPTPAPDAKVQTDPIDELVARMQAAEKALQSIALEMSTMSLQGGGAVVTTKGSLRVLRGTQAAIHCKVEFTTDDGLRGSSESVQKSNGIELFEDDTANGPVYVQLDSKLVADLEWAGEVLAAEDVPGMKARRVAAPLGSILVAHAKTHFDLAEASKKDREGEVGKWLAGPRKKGLDVEDPGLPVADIVEMFVRDKDLALLEVRYKQADKVIQHLVVDRVQIDVELPAELFKVDGGGMRLRHVQQHQPLWDMIQQTLKEAERKSKDGLVRPSKR